MGRLALPASSPVVQGWLLWLQPTTDQTKDSFHHQEESIIPPRVQEFALQKKEESREEERRGEGRGGDGKKKKRKEKPLQDILKNCSTIIILIKDPVEILVF